MQAEWSVGGGLPSPEKQESELVAAGWRKLRIGVWAAPWGALYRGPNEAWRVMHLVIALN